ncbi:MAG TPA: di-heme oxidoredictase family protein [Steroidobacteraceae bacterium]|nr:di-heme oxidoredictase family protein [Steroidobacteraceae bacterium]
MKRLQRLTPTIICLLLALGGVAADIADAQAARPAIDHRSRKDRFHARGAALLEDLATTPAPAATEAPAGFDNLTNGYLDQGPDFATLTRDTLVKGRSFNDDRYVFEEFETPAEGLGPTFNAQSCRECHQNVVTGGSSQVAEHRTGRMDNGVFFESLGGSLIQSRATYAEIVEHVNFQDDISTFRLSTNTLGDGFVEAIANETLLSIRNHQPAAIRGTAVIAPVLEATSAARVGRFGWKAQHASLESFAADAYLNELGITSPLFPEENTSSGVFVGYGTEYDPLDEPEDDGDDVEAFADFMRATKAPPRGAITPDVQAGERLFANVGCAGCHVASIRTARAGTVINGGDFVVPAALGSKIIHPYSDFLVHNIGTGDGIPVTPDPGYAGTAQQIRTAPLWGLRTRNRMMHDGLTFTYQAAIARHTVQADTARRAYLALSAAEQNQLLAFLQSL